MNKPIDRMKKILALARRGVDGEKDTAEAMLRKLLAKYGMTVADLDGEEHAVAKREFRYSTEADRSLLRQIVARVLNQKSFDCWRRRGEKKLIFELTALQNAEVDIRYTAYRSVLRKELKKAADRAFSAFVQTNDLGVDAGEDADLSSLDMEELAAIMAYMQTMAPTPIHQQIGASSTTQEGAKP